MSSRNPICAAQNTVYELASKHLAQVVLLPALYQAKPHIRASNTHTDDLGEPEAAALMGALLGRAARLTLRTPFLPPRGSCDALATLWCHYDAL